MPLSSFEEINNQYKKLAKKYHTDINEENDEIKKINKAFQILKDYIKNYKFTFSEDEIIRQYPIEFNKKFKV